MTEQVDKDKEIYLGSLNNAINKTELVDAVKFYTINFQFH